MQYQDRMVTRQKMRLIKSAGMNIGSRVEINRLTNFDSVLILRPRPGRRLSSARSEYQAGDFSDMESTSSVASFAATPGHTERLRSILKKVCNKPFTMSGRKRAKSLPLPLAENSVPSSSTSDGNLDKSDQGDDANKENEHDTKENTPQNDSTSDSNKQD